MDVTRDIIRTEGIRGLFRGLTTTLVRECPGYGFFFGSYELTRSILTSGNKKKGDIGKSIFSLKIFFRIIFFKQVL
jgi:solute carrier family 25 ornithine transporter 2/15